MSRYRKRKGTKRRYKAAVKCLCLVFLGIVLMILANQRYRAYNRAKYADQIQFYRDCLEQEKNWLAKQQTAEGAICLYRRKEQTEGSVNPYFSCQAALGMLAGKPDEQALQYAAAYLSWHTGELLRSEGFMSDYKIVSGELKPTGTYDSVDSYIALYLTLLAEFIQKGGNPETISDVEEAVAICIDRLQELSHGGLTRVSPGKEVYYLMDNLEVLEACEKMDILLKSKHATVEKWSSKERFSDYFGRMKTESRDAIETVFWNEKENRFEVAVDDTFSGFGFEGMQEFYPCAIAQVYAAACDVSVIGSESEKLLYEQISKEHAWVTLEHDTTFECPVLAYIACKIGDIQAAEAYLENYRSKYERDADRRYPYKVPDAAWSARTYAALYDAYEEKANRSLMDVFREKADTIRERQD